MKLNSAIVNRFDFDASFVSIVPSATFQLGTIPFDALQPECVCVCVVCVLCVCNSNRVNNPSSSSPSSPLLSLSSLAECIQNKQRNLQIVNFGVATMPQQTPAHAQLKHTIYMPGHARLPKLITTDSSR